jgi:hypothetical protein
MEVVNKDGSSTGAPLSRSAVKKLLAKQKMKRKKKKGKQ